MQLNYIIKGPEGAPPLLLLHELGGSHESWQWLDPELQDKFRRIIVDLPGAGKSPLLGPKMSLDEVAASLVELLDSLGIEQVNLAGSAYGAVTAAYLAGSYPERISAVMMIAVGPYISDTVKDYVYNRAEQVEANGMGLVVDYSLQSSFPAGFSEKHPGVLEAYRAIFTGNDPHNYAVCSRSIADAGTILTDRIRSIRSTAAVVGGKHDPSFTPAVVGEVASLLTPPVTPVVLEDAGHFPQIQAPRELAKLMQRFFLERQPLA